MKAMTQDGHFSWTAHRNIKLSPEGEHVLVLPPDLPCSVYPILFTMDCRLTPSFHKYFEISYIYSGRGLFHVENKTYKVKEGDVVVLGDREFHFLETLSPGPLRSLNLFFDPSFVHVPGGNAVDGAYLHPFLDGSVEWRNLLPRNGILSRSILSHIQSISKELEGQKPGYACAVKNNLCEILLILLRSYFRSPVSKRTTTQRLRDAQRLQGVFGYIKAHFCQEILLGEIARIACMSPSHFCRFFKKVTGRSFVEYIQRMRIDKAKEQLLRGNLSVSEVGFRTGFENPSYFHRTFHSLTGLTPGEYARKYGSF